METGTASRGLPGSCGADRTGNMSVSVRDLAHRDTPAADCLHWTCTPADGGGTPPSPIQQEEEEEGVIPSSRGTRESGVIG